MEQIFNPYLPLDEYIPDGEPRVFGDRVYIYGSHDKEGGEFFCMRDYVTYSAPVDNLKDWRYEGVIYKASQDPDYPNHKYMYAPDVIQGNDGRYYLFYSLADDKNGCSFLMSVAVSNSPTGPFEFHGYVKYPDSTPLQDFLIFDPGVINDNGRIYLYYGMWNDFDENPKFTREDSLKYQAEMYHKTIEEIENTEGGVQGPICVELCDDMLTVKHPPHRILPSVFTGTEFENYKFFEASSMRKIGEKYYFIYSTYNQHELAYATSDYPDKDFKFGGVIISNGDIGYNGRKPEDRLTRTGNNHGSIANINGEWFIFYHRHTHKSDFSRQACAEKIKILEDGKIPQVEVTSCGLNGGPLVAKGEYPIIICCNLTNGKMPHGFDAMDKQLPYIVYKDKERYITDVENHTLIGFKYFDFKGETIVGVTLKNGKVPPKGEIQISTEEWGEPLAKITVDDNTNWHDLFTTVNINGTKPLYLTYYGKGYIDIKTLILK